MKKGKKSTRKTIITMSVLLLVIISVYFFIRTRTAPIFKSDKKDQSEIEILISKDMVNSYPSSPREIIKLYSRIAKMYYHKDTKEEDIDKLANQMRYMFDEELLTNNPYDTYIIELKTEISTFKKANRTIINYTIQSGDEVVTWEKDKTKYASVIVTFSLKEGSYYTKVKEKFTLRKDSKDNWKILGWELLKEAE